ncbi:TPA: lipopolysaccharide heptosyltransferase RfaC [Proteus mirabilis]|nr:lipopolysaccharide heptosyltransferase RfaC [Proteus mirabilis]HAU5527013.1 lipopolysaccharide heptosyltransferase RfaC [Proteus mirabilis]HAU5534226.1 lipopolysaccharide heptosyltransferase RfaC [Proteus mirabilis]HAU5537763.1 lipopolysaccharide heptosyltransferase RfaC [Proteus mirabilis]HAU5541301.1 lipopolysaccharide heptosyltransferase RfaC [Proteus mirabilis]
MKRVLIVKTSSMGDVLHTLPALTDARAAYPEICFDWAVEEGFAQIPSWHPAVDTVIPVAIRRWRKNWFSAPIRAERARFRHAIQAHHYDAVIDAQGLLKSAFLVTRYAKGTKHGYSRHSAREPLASFFYDIRHNVSKKMHAVERIRQLFALSLNYPLPTTQGDYGIAQHFLSSPAIDKRPYLVFLHATTRDEKHWPEAHWRELIALLADSDLRIKLPWGAEHEHQRAIRLAQGFDYVDVLPKMSLAEVAQVIAGAQSVVSVDTGLSHLTAALDKPNITLFGPTDPGLIGGYGKAQRSLKAADGDIGEITANNIFSMIQK